MWTSGKYNKTTREQQEKTPLPPSPPSLPPPLTADTCGKILVPSSIVVYKSRVDLIE